MTTSPPSNNPLNKVGLTRAFLGKIPPADLRKLIPGMRRLSSAIMHPDATGSESSEYYSKLNGALSTLETMDDEQLRKTLDEFLVEGDSDIRQLRWLQKDQKFAATQVKEASRALQLCEEDNERLKESQTHLVDVLFLGAAASPKNAELPIDSRHTACCLFRCGEGKTQYYYYVTPDGRVFSTRDERPLPEFVQHQATYYSDRAFVTRAEALTKIKDTDSGREPRMRRDSQRGIFHSSDGPIHRLLGSTSNKSLANELGGLGSIHSNKSFGKLAPYIKLLIDKGDMLVLAYSTRIQDRKKEQIPAITSEVSQKVMEVAGPYIISPLRVKGPYIKH